MIDQVYFHLCNFEILWYCKDSNAYLLAQGEADDKIIAVCADDPEYKHYTDIKELPPHRLAEIRRFFEDCILFIRSIFFYPASLESTQ
jgi:hypothetical protein